MKKVISRQILLWTATLVALSTLVYLSALGGYNRPFQDDFYYYTPHSEEERDALLNERYHWTGRLTATTVHLLVGWSNAHWVVPMVSFGLMVAGIYFVSRVIMSHIAPLTKYRQNIALLLGVTLTLAIFFLTPSSYSSIFWLSAAPIHFWSYGLILIYLSYLLSLTLKQVYKWYDYCIMLAATVVIGMLGEVAAATLLGGVTIILAYGKLYRSQKILLPSLANGLGIGGAMWALFFSVGAVIRRGAEGSIPVSEVIGNAPYVVAHNFVSLVSSVLNNKETLIAVLLGGVLLGLSLFRGRQVLIGRTLLIGLLVSVACITLMSLNFVGVYASTRLTVAWDRTQAFSVICIVGMLMIFGIFVGGVLRQYLASKSIYVLRWVRVFSVAGIGLILLINTAYIPQIQRFTNSIVSRAEAYDAREEYIQNTILKSQSPTCPVVLPVTYIQGTQELFDLLPDERHALNIGVQRYYRMPCGVTGE